jgi:chitinase
MKSFTIGVYSHDLKGVKGIDRATLLKPSRESFASIHKKHPSLHLAIALHELEEAAGWKGHVKELTLMAHQGMNLTKECGKLMQQGFKIRVALPSNANLLKNLDVAALGSLDIQFDLMAFDYASPTAGQRTNFHTLLSAAEGNSVQETLHFLHGLGIALNKVHLGLADHGLMFKEVMPGINNTGYLQPCGKEQLENPQMSREAVETYLKSHASAQKFYTSLNGCFQSFIYNPENGDWISYDDSITLESKIEWAKRRGLAGVFNYRLA